MSEVVQGNNRFALELHSRLARQPGNLFYSPASLSMALAMTYAGARGETAAEMAKVLHFPADPDRLHEQFAALRKGLNDAGGGAKGSHRFSLANRLWGQRGYHFLPDFLRSRGSRTGPSWPRSTSCTRPKMPGKRSTPGWRRRPRGRSST